MGDMARDAATRDVTAGGGLAAGWLDRLRPELAGYARAALDNIGQEFPAYISTTMTAPGDFPFRPRDRNPVFYGSFDWHSCVEMFWLLVRLLKVAPADVPAAEIRAALDARLTPGGLRAEAEFMVTEHGAAMERPYGWGWALALAAELEEWDDPDAARWAARLRPLSDALAGNFLRWPPTRCAPACTPTARSASRGPCRTRTARPAATSARRCARRPAAGTGRTRTARAGGSRPATTSCPPRCARPS